MHTSPEATPLRHHHHHHHYRTKEDANLGAVSHQNVEEIVRRVHFALHGMQAALALVGRVFQVHQNGLLPLARAFGVHAVVGHLVARHRFEGPRRQAAFELVVAPHHLRERFLDEEHPHFVALWGREQRLAVFAWNVVVDGDLLGRFAWKKV